jgi:hypothetical protein
MNAGAEQSDRPFFHAPKSHYRPAHLAHRHGTDRFAAADWWRLPRKLRVRWWAETDYSRSAIADEHGLVFGELLEARSCIRREGVTRSSGGEPTPAFTAGSFS